MMSEMLSYLNPVILELIYKLNLQVWDIPVPSVVTKQLQMLI